jgi:serine/threonine protein kinase
MPKECKYVSTCFVVEREKLHDWATSAGLDKYTDEASVSASIRNTRLPLLDILTEMKTSITDFFILNAKYSEIDISALEKVGGGVGIQGKKLAEVLELPDGPLEPVPGVKKNFLQRRVQGAKELGKDVKEVVTHPKRILWVVFDRKAAEKLITKLQNLNGYLHTLLDDHQMRVLVETTHDTHVKLVQMQTTVEGLSRLIEAMKLNAPQHESPAAGNDPGPYPDALTPGQKNERRNRDMVSALAKFKELVLSLKRHPANLPPNTIQPRNVMNGRLPALYTETAGGPSTPIWVEWKAFKVKMIPGGAEQDPNILPRIEQLAALLTSQKPAQLCVPPYLGFFKTKEPYAETGHFGFVFKAPENTPVGNKAISLLTVIEEEAKRKLGECPSLTARVSLVRKLATCLLYLHSVGWLHKGLRSDNVLFFSGQQNPLITDPYLVGFDYARPDKDGEKTEPVPYEPGWELYRHPDYNGIQPARARKTFDIYSLGIIMIEVALWRSIGDIFPQEDQPDKDIVEESQEEASTVALLKTQPGVHQAPDKAENIRPIAELTAKNQNQSLAKEIHIGKKDEEESKDKVKGTHPEAKSPGGQVLQLGRVQQSISEVNSQVSREIRSRVGDKYFQAIQTCIDGRKHFQIDRRNQETDPETAIKLQKDFKRLVINKLEDVAL